MDDSVLTFYEQLADHYHLIFPDWQAAVQQQGKILPKQYGRVRASVL